MKNFYKIIIRVYYSKNIIGEKVSPIQIHLAPF